MRQVRLADLKARLSEYLREVRRGEILSMLERQTPVAQIVPLPEALKLRIHGPAPGSPKPGAIPLPEPLTLNVDVVDVLLEQRQGHR
jgi:antitoxin (DNA-binding transcriptional repressor) of toxin-antitoxin stability system